MKERRDFAKASMLPDPQISSIEAFGLVFNRLTTALYPLCHAILARNDPEDLHRFRVHLRRILSLLHIADGVLEKKIRKRFEKDLKRILSFTNTKRDLDVLMSQVREIGGKSSSLSAFELFLQKEIQTEYDTIVSFLRTDTYALTIRRWRDFLENEYRFFLESDYDEQISHLVSVQLRRLLGKIEKRIEKIDKKRHFDPHKLHKLRIDFKRLRYLIEAFEPIFPRKFVRKELASVKKLQDLLGIYHDSYRQEKLLEHYLKAWRARNEEVRIVEKRILPTIRRRRKRSAARIEKALKRFCEEKARYENLYTTS